MLLQSCDLSGEQRSLEACVTGWTVTVCCAAQYLTTYRSYFRISIFSGWYQASSPSKPLARARRSLSQARSPRIPGMLFVPVLYAVPRCLHFPPPSFFSPLLFSSPGLAEAGGSCCTVQGPSSSTVSSQLGGLPFQTNLPSGCTVERTVTSPTHSPSTDQYT